MKKFVALMLSLLLVFSFCACTAEPAEDGDDKDNKTGKKTEEKISETLADTLEVETYVEEETATAPSLESTTEEKVTEEEVTEEVVTEELVTEEPTAEEPTEDEYPEEGGDLSYPDGDIIEDDPFEEGEDPVEEPSIGPEDETEEF